MINYQLFESGYCHHCERMTLKSGRMKKREYPATCVLLHHPDAGYILFDTGYSNRFFQITRYFPFSLYRYLTPVTLDKSLKEQLIEQNIQPEAINYIVISHFHADHIGGLKDFPNARFICHKEALDDIAGKNRLRALVQGVLPALLPQDFYERTIKLGNNTLELGSHLHPFKQGFDLFNDGTIIAIPLPGHAKGQIGLYVKSERDVFFVADSCWHSKAFQDLDLPSAVTYMIHDNKEQYIQTIKNLHTLHQHNQDIRIIPAHCEHTRNMIKKADL